MCIDSRAPHCRTVLRNRQDRTLKASYKKQSIIEYSPGLQDTKSLRSYWKPSKDASQKLSWNQKSLPIYQVIRLLHSDSFSTLPPIVNGGDLETIIVLVLLAFNFILQRSHHSIILPRSLFGDSATVTLTTGDGPKSHRHNRSAYSPKWNNVPRCTGWTITDQNTALQHCWRNINQFTPTTVHHNVL